jgi:hypothetical protein
MMAGMTKGTRVLTGASCVVALVACGGQTNRAQSPGPCPEGTALQGSDCLPTSANSASSEEAPAPSPVPSPATDATSNQSSAASPPYDREAVEAELKRAARSIKANCGAATNDDGQATGPWGATQATVTLGRNGHIKQVSVPAPYAGQPVGVCVVHAVQKIWFPPYAASADVSVDWDVEIVKPKN